MVPKIVLPLHQQTTNNMGQRHQTFVRVLNPVNVVRKIYATDRMIKVFGKDKYTVLPFHNQWLYGRSALQQALNLLTHSSQFNQTQLEGIGIVAKSTPLSSDGIGYMFTNMDKYIRTIEFILGYIPVATQYNNAGMLGSYFIGESEPEMRHDFTLGDNNDGITIIDTITNKYCFMNICEWSDRTKGEFMSSSIDLPYLKPVSAHAYVKAYYSENPKTINPSHLDRYNQLAPQEIVSKFKKENNGLVKPMSKFEVLTIEEIKDIFPNFKFPQ